MFLHLSLYSYIFNSPTIEYMALILKSAISLDIHPSRPMFTRQSNLSVLGSQRYKHCQEAPKTQTNAPPTKCPKHQLTNVSGQYASIQKPLPHHHPTTTKAMNARPGNQEISTIHSSPHTRRIVPGIFPHFPKDGSQINHKFYLTPSLSYLGSHAVQSLNTRTTPTNQTPNFTSKLMHEHSTASSELKEENKPAYT